VLPPIVYVDRDGVGWTRHPEWLLGEYPDEGQHDIWKREMRVFLWRALHGPEEAGSMNIRVVGLEDRLETIPTLFPVGQQLAEASQRLGFMRLARAAMPEIADADLLKVHAKHEQAVKAEADRRHAHNTKTAETWPTHAGPFHFDSREQTIALLTLGPPNGKPNNAPLNPINLKEEALPRAQFSAPRITRGKR
jgi:hypothetical protein